MSRVPFAIWLLPGLVLLPLFSGPLLDRPSWVKVGLASAGIALPGVVVVARYLAAPEPSEEEVPRRRLAVAGVIVLAVFTAVWMVGVVEHETRLGLDTVGAANDQTVDFDVFVRLPSGALLDDVAPVGGRVKVFYPDPDDPSRHRLLLWEPPVTNDVDLIVTWRLPVWRTVGEVTVSIAPAEA